MFKNNPFIFVAAFLISTFVVAQKKVDVSMYPKAQAGTEQQLLILPELDKEDDYEVELFVGKKLTVDQCNKHFLMGSFSEETVLGWGYNYFDFKSEGNAAGTLMGCMDTKTVEKMVYAQPKKVRYNSKLPIVIYAPKGYQVEYRLWKAGDRKTVTKK